MDPPQVPDFLCCPVCRSELLEWIEDLVPLSFPFDVRRGARCANCARQYPYVDGVWVMWSDEIKSLQLDQLNESAEPNLQIKRANIEVYREVAVDYDDRQGHDRTKYIRELTQLKKLARDHVLDSVDSRQKVVVDVACATGVGLLQQPFDSATLVGVDISLENLKAVRNKQVLPVLADAERLPFRRNSIDLITCFAAMHHFPDPLAFLKSSNECLRKGGVCLTSADPTKRALSLGPLARFAYELRRPVYRILAKSSSRFHFHQNEFLQQTNDLAECQRTRGGFDTTQLGEWLGEAGFSFRQVFLDTSPHAKKVRLCPNWKVCLLKILSFQNPFLLKNYAPVSTISRK